MLYERSSPSKANREEIGLTPSDACRLIAICIDLIDLCAKVTGKIDPRSHQSLAMPATKPWLRL